MQLNPTEISDLIKSRIEQFEVVAEARTEGTIVSLSDGIARIHGLADVMQGEMIEFPGNLFGMALNLERDSVGAVVLGDYKTISEGDSVKCTGRILEVPVGEALLGRVVDSLGNPIDGKGPVGFCTGTPTGGDAYYESIAVGFLEGSEEAVPEIRIARIQGEGIGRIGQLCKQADQPDQTLALLRRMPVVRQQVPHSTAHAVHLPLRRFPLQRRKPSSARISNPEHTNPSVQVTVRGNGLGTAGFRKAGRLC